MNNNFKLNISTDNGLGEVGIWFKNNTLTIIFPKNYTFDDNNLYNDISLLSQCLEKYSKIKLQKNVYTTSLDESSYIGQSDFSFMSLFKLINNYIENGYYSEVDKYYKINGKHNIDFVRTTNKFSPYIIDDNFLFLDHITRSTKTNHSNPLTQIHKYVIENAFAIIGFFYPQVEYESNCTLPFSKSYCISILEKTINETFNDDKRAFFEMLLSFFKIVKLNNSDVVFYHCKKFDVIWERMLHSLLSNQDVSDYYFNSTWNLIDPPKIKTNSPSRPDLINISQSYNLLNIYIIDAKYYTYSSTNYDGTLPSTSDINKQILYKYNAKMIVEKKFPGFSYNYVNCFILPKDSSGSPLNYLGYAISDFDKEEIVQAFSIDIKLIMKNYIKSYKSTTFENYVLSFINKFSI